MRVLRAFVALLLLTLLAEGSASAQIHFTNVSPQAGISFIDVSSNVTGGGILVFDYDGDGWDDVLCLGGMKPDSLFLNNRNGTFGSLPDQAGLTMEGRKPRYTRGGIAVDYDKDGLPDLYLTCQNGSDLLYHHKPNGGFEDVTRAAGVIIPQGVNDNTSATFGDFNGDGFADIYVARWVKDFDTEYDSVLGRVRFDHTALRNWLYINNGNGTFTEAAEQYNVADSGTSLIAMFIDYDQDGDLDLVIGNDFGIDIRPNAVYRNMLMETGHATFQEVAYDIGLQDTLFCMGIGAGDPDRDADFDFFETSIGPVRYMKQESGRFHDAAEETGLQLAKTGPEAFFDPTAWTAIFSDFDNDGWEDLYVVHGIQEISYPWRTADFDTTRFYHNDGGHFSDVTTSSGFIVFERGRSGALLDFDHDGKPDLLYGPDNYPTNQSMGVRLLHNTSPNHNHWIEFKLNGVKGIPEAIGTTIHVWSDGVDHMRQVTTGGTYLSMNTLVQHVGLADAQVVDSMIVMWPAYISVDGKPHRTVERYRNIAADRIVQITEGEGEPVTYIRTVAAPVNSTISRISAERGFLRLDASVRSANVYDMLGRAVAVKVTGGIAVATWPSGLYFVEMQLRDGSTVTERWVNR